MSLAVGDTPIAITSKAAVTIRIIQPKMIG
jgi:hypothetical protein